MIPERINFWGIPDEPIRPEIYLYIILGISALILLLRFYNRFNIWWRIGLPEKRWDRVDIRLGRLIKYTIIQTRILRQRYPGIMHVAIAWSFFMFFIGTALATIDADFYKILVGDTYLIYKFILDSFTILFFIGISLAVYRRYIQKSSKLTLSRDFTYTLILITIIVASGLLVESLRLAEQKPDWAISSPAGWTVAQLWIAMGLSSEILLDLHLGFWTFHWIIVAFSLIVLPVSTLVHLLSSPLNVFFSKIDKVPGQLAPVRENIDHELVYVKNLSDLSWKQLLDGDACTECGRCQDACPADASGTPLNPKQLILGIRDTLHTSGSIKFSDNSNSPLLISHTITDEVLWSCTTCGACVRECPVLIEHIDTIVDMRRNLVIEGKIDPELQDTLGNIARYGNSFGKSERMRARWARKIEPVIKNAREENVKYLWYVGDYASYSSTLTDVTKLTANVFNKANLDFGILYDAEKNSGNDVRRVGEEGLYEMLFENNVEVINQCEFDTIITTDPHTLNTLKHEYKFNGKGNFDVLHYTELLDDLITNEVINFSIKLDYKVTYHDPCYLARYNDIYEAPRRIIQATGCALIEMPRHGDRTFCCGAGGGRIWMEDDPNIIERPAEIRIKEAANIPGVSVFVVTCPKDLVMFQDAVKTTGLEKKIIVKDLIELVGEAQEIINLDSED